MLVTILPVLQSELGFTVVAVCRTRAALFTVTKA